MEIVLGKHFGKINHNIFLQNKSKKLTSARVNDDDHVAVLGRGVAAWNAWRAENGESPDLSRAGLRGLDLTGFDFSRADLRQADLRGTNRFVTATGVRLKGARADQVSRGCDGI
jgi:uncharacterized protein YjbI with pentapeptide repeats